MSGEKADLKVALAAYRGGQAAADVLNERLRQITGEGWDEAHDDEHANGEMAAAAAAYATNAVRAIKGQTNAGVMPGVWPKSWDWEWWKPRTPRKDLVRAGALILAEIERLDRAAAPAVQR